MGKSVSSREAIQALETNGWTLVGVSGSHHQFRHPTIAGRITVKHPAKDLTIGQIKDIEKKSGITLR